MSKVSKNFNYKAFFNQPKTLPTQTFKPPSLQSASANSQLMEGIGMKTFSPSQSPSLPLKWDLSTTHDVDSVVESFKRNTPLILQIISPTCPQCSKLQQHDKLFVVTYGVEKRMKCMDILRKKDYTVPLVARRVSMQPFNHSIKREVGNEINEDDIKNNNETNNLNNNNLSNANNNNMLNKTNNNNNNNNNGEKSEKGMLCVDKMESKVQEKQKRYLDKLKRMCISSSYQASYIVVARLKRDLLVPPLMAVSQDDNIIFRAASGIHCDKKINNKPHNDNNIKNENIDNHSNNDIQNINSNRIKHGSNDNDDVVINIVTSDKADDDSGSLWQEYYQMHAMSAKSFCMAHLDASIDKIYVEAADIGAHQEHIKNHKECLHNTSIRIDNYKINKSASDLTEVNKQAEEQGGLKKQNKLKSIYKSCQLFSQDGSAVLSHKENSLSHLSDEEKILFNDNKFSIDQNNSEPQKSKKNYPHMGTSVVVSGRRSFDHTHLTQQLPIFNPQNPTLNHQSLNINQQQPIINQQKIPTINQQQPPIINQQQKTIINQQQPTINQQQPTISHYQKPTINQQQKPSKKYQETSSENEFQKFSKQTVDIKKQNQEYISWDKSTSGTSKPHYTKHTHEFVIKDKIHTTSNPTIQKKLNPNRHSKQQINMHKKHLSSYQTPPTRLSSLFSQNNLSTTNLPPNRDDAPRLNIQHTTNLYKSLSSTTLHLPININTLNKEITEENKSISNFLESTTRKSQMRLNTPAAKNSTLCSVDEGYYTTRSKEYFI